MEAVPAEWRSSIIGGRIAIGAIVSFIVTLACGQILIHLPFPASYQAVFLIGFVGGMLTIYQIMHIYPLAGRRPPDGLVELQPAAARLGITAQKSGFFPPLNSRGRYFLRVIGMLFGLGVVNNMAAPLIPNLLVHQLNLSDALISIGASTNTILVFLVAPYMGRLNRRTGNRSGTSLGIALLAGQTTLLGLARSSTSYLASAAIGGSASGVLNVSQTNYVIENIPDSEPSRWLSVNLLLGNTAVLLGALGGPFIAGLLGTPASLILFGILELLIGIVIFRWG